MRRVNFKLLGPLLFIVFIVVFFSTIISRLPKILILHSYNTDYIWTNLIDESLKHELRKKPKLRTQFFYMNTKLFYNKSSEKSAIRTIEQFDPNIIIAFDDNAQKFLSKYYLNKNIPIIFAGVNGHVDKYNYVGHENVTGIFERKSVEGVIFVLSQLNRHNKTHSKKNVLLLTDNTFASQQDKIYLSKQDWQDFKFTTASVETFDQWKNFVRGLADKNIDYLIVSGYRKLLIKEEEGGIKHYAPAKIVAEWTQINSPIEIVATNVFSAEDGFMLAVGNSPHEQAQTAIEMAEHVFYKKVKPGDIAYRHPKFYSISINEKAIRNRPDIIPPFLEAFARASRNVF